MAAKFELKKSASGKYHFNLKAGNGEVVLSSEMYKSKAAAENGITSVKANALSNAQFERKSSTKGEPYFVLKAANHEIIGRSEMYSGAAACENGIASVMKNASSADISDLTSA